MMRNTATRAFDTKETLDLTILFLNRSLFEAISKKNAPLLRRCGHCRAFPTIALYACIGLEIAASLTRVASFEDMWCKNVYGLEYFRTVMGRDKFEPIRSAMRVYPSYDHDVSTKDPLWHSRLIIQYFRRNRVKVAVPTRVTAFSRKYDTMKGPKSSAIIYE